MGLINCLGEYYLRLPAAAIKDRGRLSFELSKTQKNSDDQRALITRHYLIIQLWWNHDHEIRYFMGDKFLCINRSTILISIATSFTLIRSDNISVIFFNAVAFIQDGSFLVMLASLSDVLVRISSMI